MILLIDNYDSFSYNLYQLAGEITPDIRVIRNDEMTVEEIRQLRPERIILSPGPGRPEDAGVIVEAAGELGKEIPLLGICLGHQAVCAAFGATVTYAKELMHGKQSKVRLNRECPLFRGCPETVPVMSGDNRPNAGRRNHGGTAQRIPRLRAAVSSRVDHDAGWEKDAGKFF